MDGFAAVGGSDLVDFEEAALEVTVLSGRAGIRARGEISAVTCPRWEQALSVLSDEHAAVLVVELSEVSFVDVAGATALAVTAMSLPAGRVVVERPPPQLPRLLDLFWPELDRIEVVPR